MRQARFLPPRRRLLRSVPLLGLVLAGWGCQQPPSFFYYGSGAPACMPVVPAPAPAVNGKVGEPPTEVIEGGTTSADSAARTTTVVGSASGTSPRVVVSDPDNQPRSMWRPNPRPDTDIATTVEGAVSSSNSSDSSVNR